MSLANWLAPQWERIGLAGLALVGTSLPASAVITINVGTQSVSTAQASVEVPIIASGGDLFSDMAAVIQIGDGGPTVGGTAGPMITNITFSGSVWQAAPGGFTNFSSLSLPREISDPSVSLLQPNQTVPATGLLMRISVLTGGFPAGDYPVKIVGTALGDSLFARTGSVVAAQIANGLIRITNSGAACSFTVEPALASFLAAGGGGSVTVKPSGASCAWTATNSVPWITINSGGSGTGTGAVLYTVSPQPSGAFRQGAMTIGGKTVQVVQAFGLQSVQRTGAAVRVGFPLASNLNHFVQSSGSLVPVGVAWSNLPGGPHNSGTASDTNITGIAQFYRVLLVPP